MKKSTKKVHKRSSSRSKSQAPSKTLMLIVSLIGGGIALMLSGNLAVGVTVFAAIGIGNWLVYHRGVSV